MRRFLLFFVPACLYFTLGMSQSIIFKETFGTTGYYAGSANGYTGMVNDRTTYYTSDNIIVQNYNVSSYDGASGQSHIFVNAERPTFTIRNLNTTEHNNCRIGFGTACWAGLPSSYMQVSYSTNGTDWTNVDVGSLNSGSYTNSPGGSAPWGWVRLNAVLPASSTLQIRFVSTNATQGFFLDDIEISGISNDATPPSKPTGVVADNIFSGSFRLRWNASTDNQGIDYYQIRQDGAIVATTSALSYVVQYLSPGDYNFTVVAIDVAGNLSEASDVQMVTIPDLPVDYKYSWEESQATVLPTGDLVWAPKDFVYNPGASVRYIDYEGGSNTNDGLTPSTAWKHHPWDPSATGNSLACSGVHTYVFKRGVIYRGYLNAKESGESGNPIKLTSDPAWGSGEACIYGSVRVTGGWTQANSTVAPTIPNPELVYYQDITGLGQTKCIYELDGSNFGRVRVARIPNFKDTGSDPMKDWWSFTGKQTVGGKLQLTDTKNLTTPSAATYTGATVWAIEDAIVMSTLWKQTIESYSPADNRIVVPDPNFGGIGFKYFIENSSYLLDTTGEFYYNGNRLFIRLDEDKNPNMATLEIATRSKLIDINNRSNIEISGLVFGFTTYNNVRYGEGDAEPTIKLTGACRGIEIRNCVFRNLNGGISAVNSSDQSNPAQNISVTDNRFDNMDDFGVFFNESGGSFFHDVNILRNKFYNIGSRHLGRWYSSISTIRGLLVNGEVAGNIIEYSWGSGINITWGKNSGNGLTIPFVRGLMHHNKVSHSLMGVNDYGGIEGWQGGPAFYYNNISHDAQGYKYNWNSSLGYAFYFDGAFKQYVFNNIASGTGWNKNGALYTQVLGFYNIWAHNNAYNAKSFSSSGGETIAPDGQNAFLANAMDSLEYQFNHTTRTSGIPFESYKNNVFSGRDFSGNFVQGGSAKNFENFVSGLQSYQADESQLGFETSSRVFSNPSAGDFRPTSTSELVDRGVKFFVPYPLSRVVGEWHFYKHRADSSLIKADNFYFTSEYTSRETYNNVPKNTLKAYGLSDTSFRHGALEDWTPGALYFNGNSTYCTATHASVSARVCNNVDMTTNNFIVEVYFKTNTGHTGGTLVAKYPASGKGYQMYLNGDGNILMALISGGVPVYFTASAAEVNDGQWHHVLAEVNRGGAIKLFVDGQLDNGVAAGGMSASESISNSGDFFIGKNINGNFFKGTIDFVRISKGLLKDAKTTFEELYKWQFDGPFLKDFTGSYPVGKRDAGAIEVGEKLCEMTIEPERIEFENVGGSQDALITAANGFEITKQQGYSFDYLVDGNSIRVEATQNYQYENRAGELWVYGCNETKKYKISQLGMPCTFSYLVPTEIDFPAEGAVLWYPMSTNGVIEITKSGNLPVSVSLNATQDSIRFYVGRATVSSQRSNTVTITGCGGQFQVVVYQNRVTALQDVEVNELVLSPNPSQGKVWITIPGTAGKDNMITIADITGKVLFADKIQDGISELDVNLPSGLYFVEVTGQKSKFSSKLVIE